LLSTTASSPPFITRAPRDLAQWARLFDPSTLPVLASTVAEIETLAEIEDEVDAHGLAEAIGSDPLMTLKVLAHLARLRRGRDGSDTETLTAALVMLGIPPFFRTFAGQASVEERLAGEPDALAGFREVLRRSHRAARFAIAFAVHRMDHDAAVIHDAALLHDFAELLLWLSAPKLALEIAKRQRADPQLRSAAVQREVLGIELAELQHQLMLSWRLPALLVAITDDHARRETPQLANVRLAIRVARHSAQGWENPALPDDIEALSQLLQLGAPHVQRLLLDIDQGP
jgi:HD-like signal output (HDOD) protein